MSKRPLNEDHVIPLTPPEFHLLLALAGRPLSGYGIMQECEVDSEGLVQPGSGTIYPALKRFSRNGWVTEEQRGPGRGSHHDRIVYTLTDTGRLVLSWEADRLRRAANLAEHRLPQPPPPPAAPKPVTIPL